MMRQLPLGAREPLYVVHVGSHEGPFGWEVLDTDVMTGESAAVLLPIGVTDASSPGATSLVDVIWNPAPSHWTNTPWDALPSGAFVAGQLTEDVVPDDCTVRT
jgi:hypothetical protein